MRLRLILSFIIIVLISVATVAIIVRQGAASEVRAFMFRGGMTDVAELASTLEEYYQTHGTWDGVEAMLRGPARGMGRGPSGPGMMNMPNQRLRLADENGRILMDTAGLERGENLNRDELSRSIPLMNGNDTVGYLLPEGGSAFTATDERRLVGRLTRAVLTAGLIGGGVSLLLALLLAYQLLRPVREMTQAATQMARGDLTQRVSVRGDDELATMGQAFNEMAASLQRAEITRRAMTADIAHELRNPLAVQRANLEALQDGVYPLTPENLAPIIEQNQLLNRLVEDLRTLALADSGQLQLERTAVDFPALVKRLAGRIAPQAAAQDVQMQVEIPENLPVLHLDPLRIEQIINNLLSNALRHTPPQGKIGINVQLQSTPSGKDTVQLSVRDSGSGIPVEALPRIFERFYRADRSRSRSEGGTGLGLAIARQLAEAHGGRLSAANHPDGGAIFTLEFPVQKEMEKS